MAYTAYVHQGAHDWGMLKQFCSKCHNTTDWAGGVAYTIMKPSQVPANPSVFEAAIVKLSGRLMPPPGNRQPPQKKIDQFVSWLTNYLDAAQAAGEEPLAGHVQIQRLDRTQYADSVKSLLGVNVDVKDLLPPETEVDGFDNIAAALSMSPTFLDQYVRAARVIANLAVGAPTVHTAISFTPSPRTDQANYLSGMPPGSRGGMAFVYNFPASGEYKFTIKDLDVGLYTWAVETRNTVVLLIDGKEVFRQNLGGLKDLELADRYGPQGRAKIMARFANIPVYVESGQHRVAVTFIQRSEAESDDYVDTNAFFDGLREARMLGGVQIAGPYGPTRLSMTASRKKIFICQPQSPTADRACAVKITRHLAELAFRRPVTQSDLDTLMPFYDRGARAGGFDLGINHVVAAILASPDFLYRTILPTRNADDGKLHELSNLELASRLSFFLWDQGPDKELLDLAIAGKLTDPKVLDAQTLRMLKDPRAESLVTDFAFHWLDLDKVSSVVPDRQLFPSYSPQLEQDFLTEARLFIGSIFLGNQSVVGLLNAHYTYLNQQLARYYGIDTVFGTQFRRVVLKNPVRWGLLGKGAMLMETSYANRTSPVRRGAWILDKILGAPPHQPPPAVNMNLDVKPGQRPTTVRARLALHRADPFCAQCHGVIDPYGLALENFSATGAWRTYDYVADEPIDAHSTLPNGVKVDGVNGLRRDLVSRPQRFADALTAKLMMSALARKLDYFDMPQVRAIVRAAKKDDYRFDSIVLGIVNSDDFHLQAEPKPAASSTLKVADIVNPNGTPGR
jgi:Protein of unknown function (DUF1592)/Protein of unknown function (DUF1588)/Protein of unknown function (DUF1587)/Protein of unknown function (DUF1585)/Protein of unknown function (DUF1595)